MSKNKRPLTPVTIDESSLGWKIFEAFVSDGQISVTEDELRTYAVKELKFPPEIMPEGLMEYLPVILVAFMNMWSGWHFKGEFLAGKIEKGHYFQRFQKFLIHKMNYTVRSHFTSVMKQLDDEKVRAQIKGATEQSHSEFSPFAVSIQCPPHMLNTIVFSNVQDDVIMKQHLGSPWQDLNLNQLLNWPHIEVKFSTPDLFFIRRQATEFVRYLNFLPHESSKQPEDIIENVESWGQQDCYSYNYFENYTKVYLEVLKSVPAISPSQLSDIQILLTHFLEDIRYIDVNKSMPTNTLVLFRMSPVPFIRNKKLVKNPEKEKDDSRVGYCEIIIPKIQLLVMYFKAKQKDTPQLSFEYTDKIKECANNLDIALPTITFKCTYCNAEFNNASTAKDDVHKHLKAEHKMEQHVRCTVCKKQFDVLDLSACRWRHKCISQLSRIASQTIVVE